MQISAAPIIYGLIFFAVLLLVEGIYLTIFGKSISLNNRVNRRLALMEKGESREKVLEQLRKEMGQHMSVKGIPLYSVASMFGSRTRPRSASRCWKSNFPMRSN
jgi:tight adherence protein B